MGLKIKSFITTFLMITAFATTINAAWEGPVELISGTWGSNNDQFGIEYGDTNDVFGGPFYILLDGRIIVTDLMNGRRKIYEANGILAKVVKCVKGSTGEWNEECRIPLSDYILTTTDGNIWVGPLEYLKQQGYSLYSPTGALVRTTTERPLELGKVKEKKTAGGYTYTVQYPDITNPNITKTYTVSVAEKVREIRRDSSGNLYAIVTGGGEDTNDVVYRYDINGQLTGKMQIPDSQYSETILPPDKPYSPGRIYELIVQYGSAVISPNGDVYTWKRTPTTYSIIKWTWRP